MVNGIMEKLLALQTLELQMGRGARQRDAEIRALRKAIPAPILGHFDRMLVRGRKAVAVVRHGTCTACHVCVAIGVLAALAHGDDVQLCGNCGRYLYLPVDEPVLPSSAVAKPAPARRGKMMTVHDL